MLAFWIGTLCLLVLSAMMFVVDEDDAAGQ
jgi:hypothetical protein